MRRRALESMRRGRRDSAEEESTRSPLDNLETKKIIIPLNDDSDTEEDFTDMEEEGGAGGGKETPEETAEEKRASGDSSSSDSDSSSDDDSSDDDSDVSLSDDGKEDPTFIVTLEGIDKAYFKQKRAAAAEAGDAKASAAPTSVAAVQQQPKVSKGVLKGAIGSTSLPLVISPVKKGAADTKKTAAPAAKSTPATKLGEASGDASSKAQPGQQKKPPPPAASAAADASKASKKPTAPVAPMKIRVKPEKAASRPGQEQSSSSSAVPAKKPEAKVAPVSRQQPPQSKPSDKPKRTRITAPEPDRPAARHSDPLSSSSFPSTPAPDSSSEVCRFWPNCTRGDKCFYAHPSSSSSYEPRSSRRPPHPPHHHAHSQYGGTDRSYQRQSSAPALRGGSRYDGYDGGRGGYHGGGDRGYHHHHHHSSRSADAPGRDKFRWTSASVLP